MRLTTWWLRPVWPWKLEQFVKTHTDTHGAEPPQQPPINLPIRSRSELSLMQPCNQQDKNHLKWQNHETFIWRELWPFSLALVPCANIEGEEIVSCTAASHLRAVHSVVRGPVRTWLIWSRSVEPRGSEWSGSIMSAGARALRTGWCEHRWRATHSCQVTGHTVCVHKQTVCACVCVCALEHYKPAACLN